MMVALGDSGLEVADSVVHSEQVGGIHSPFHCLQPLQVRATLGAARVGQEIVGFVGVGAGRREGLAQCCHQPQQAAPTPSTGIGHHPFVVGLALLLLMGSPLLALEDVKTKNTDWKSSWARMKSGALVIWFVADE